MTPEIMVPLVGMAEELRQVRERIVAVAEEVMAERSVRVDYTIGTMIELPRRLRHGGRHRRAHRLLLVRHQRPDTGPSSGFRRDDAGRFLPAYLEKRLLERDPFVELDREGVGDLVRMGIERGRQTVPRPQDRHLRGARREPGLDRVLHEAGFDYVSCSPYRVRIARLAAAQAALRGAAL